MFYKFNAIYIKYTPINISKKVIQKLHHHIPRPLKPNNYRRKTARRAALLLAASHACDMLTN